MQRIALLITFIFFSQYIFAQELTQTIRGTIVDADSRIPLIGATIYLIDSEPFIGSFTDASGKFKFDNVPVGRWSLQLSYLGYESKTIPNIEVNSAKEIVLELEMQESLITIEEAIVQADLNKGETTNDMAMISARSISPEETNRYAGGFNDPSRITSNFAGVTNTQDGSNDIIIRGNSPKYIQWRLEGVQITNPNHFGDQSAVGGSISALNNNLLGASDFHTGAFTSEFGDVLSGVYDVKLRPGNNEKFESIFGFGLLGTDLTLEGPFKKGYGGSYIVNYRYSTASIIDKLGLIDVGGVPKFQDATFKVVLPTKNLGVFSIFGLGGSSEILFKDVKPALWQTPGNNSMRTEIKEDYGKEAYLINTGINHVINTGENSFLKTAISYSNEGIKDEILESTVAKIYDTQGEFVEDSVLSSVTNFNGTLNKSVLRGTVTYNWKLNARNKFVIGSKYALMNFDFQQNHLNDSGMRFTLVDIDENIGTLRNFATWKHRLNEKLTILTGLHNMNVRFNNKSTLEFRAAMNWNLTPTTILSLGYGNHSTMESVHNYFSKVVSADGTISEPNRDLDLLKAHHYVLGVEKRIGEFMMFKAELYYQDLYNLPVENNDTSYYATINEGLEFRYVDLVNEGTGRNYGIELTLERFFANNYYFMLNGSVYESKYTALEGIERNTQYNGSYLVNILAGKEFTKLGKEKNQTFGINTKLFFGGGKKVIPLLRDEDGNLAVNQENDEFWDYSKAYEDSIEDLHQVTISASYKWNRPQATHELFLNLDNVTNNKGKSSEYYDEDEEGNIGYVQQFGFFPNVMYRVYF